MTLTIHLPPSTLEKVNAKVAASGKDVDTVVRKAVELGLTKRKQSLASILKPINEAIQASGLSEQEVNDLFAGELQAHRAGRSKSL